MFIDEALKISSKDTRSPFYYKVADMLNQRKNKSYMIFASPNIPNPEIYLKLISDTNSLSEQKLITTFTPVNQIKYFIDFIAGEIQLFNNYSGNFTKFAPLNENITFYELISHFGNNAQNIVYCDSIAKAVRYAVNLQKISINVMKKYF